MLRKLRFRQKNGFLIKKPCIVFTRLISLLVPRYSKYILSYKDIYKEKGKQSCDI